MLFMLFTSAVAPTDRSWMLLILIVILMIAVFRIHANYRKEKGKANKLEYAVRVFVQRIGGTMQIRLASMIENNPLLTITTDDPGQPGSWFKIYRRILITDRFGEFLIVFVNWTDGLEDGIQVIYRKKTKPDITYSETLYYRVNEIERALQRCKEIIEIHVESIAA